MLKFQCLCKKKTLQSKDFLFTSPNKSNLHSFVFEIVPLSSVKSQNMSLMDFLHSLEVGKISIHPQMEELITPRIVEAAKDTRPLVKQESVFLINSQLECP